MASNTITYNITSLQSKIIFDFKSEIENLFDEIVSRLESKMQDGMECYNQYNSKIESLFSKYENCIDYDNPNSSYILTFIRKNLVSQKANFSDYEFFYENGDVSQLIFDLNLKYDSDLFNDIQRYIKDNMDIESFINDYFPDSFDFSEMEDFISENEDRLYRIENILKRKLHEKERKQSLILKKKQIEDLKLKIEELEKDLMSIKKNLL
jgi:hypothetical protein